MADTVTKLNKDTVAGGDVMDESLVPNSHPDAPSGMAKRPRVVIGDDDGALVDTATEGGITKLQVKAASLPLPSGAATDAAVSQLTKPSDQQHVLIDNFPGTQPVSGPLTDTQLRASAVPVSSASLPLPSGASTEATLAAIKAKTDNLDVALSTRTKPIDNQNVLVTNWPSGLGSIEKTLYDIDDPAVFYIGAAPQGTASGASAWLIKRILFDGSGNPLSTTWTSNTAVWDNRTTETYT